MVACMTAQRMRFVECPISSQSGSIRPWCSAAREATGAATRRNRIKVVILRPLTIVVRDLHSAPAQAGPAIARWCSNGFCLSISTLCRRYNLTMSDSKVNTATRLANAAIECVCSLMPYGDTAAKD
jgi:hypothetical protein